MSIESSRSVRASARERAWCSLIVSSERKKKREWREGVPKPQNLESTPSKETRQKEQYNRKRVSGLDQDKLVNQAKEDWDWEEMEEEEGLLHTHTQTKFRKSVVVCKSYLFRDDNDNSCLDRSYDLGETLSFATPTVLLMNSQNYSIKSSPQTRIDKKCIKIWWRSRERSIYNGDWWAAHLQTQWSYNPFTRDCQFSDLSSRTIIGDGVTEVGFLCYTLFIFWRSWYAVLMFSRCPQDQGVCLQKR